ncbi:hypoxia-inducible factor 1-alpha-like isoform X2 [Littorina saxatilis]|uniref:Hypoxia-inducible factor 1-alpha n=1 Tax=Littorina saxatilis TaxID=31220 RepID=A0AAN9BD15_9CAEN
MKDKKDKRKNNEVRKLKSKYAARSRRDKETNWFTELAKHLPLPASVSSQLDKASVMRLTISFFKICNVLEQHDWSEFAGGKTKFGRYDQEAPKALDGFMFILSGDGDIVYVNEKVVKYLGIQQMELMGQSIFEFAHPRDEDEIREALSTRPQRHKAPVTEEHVFFLRLKCTLTSKGRNVNLKSANYKVIKCTGRLVMKSGRRQLGGSSLFSPYLLAMGEPIPHPANIEIPLDNNTFLSKHDMNMRFTYCDDRVSELLNYSSDELLGKSLYDYHHALDSGVVEKAYKDLLGKGKGQTMTGQYRFLARGGGMAWVVTQATVIYNNRNQKAQWIVCVHYVLSHIEQKDLILSDVQLPIPKCLPAGLQLSTESIISRKTDDMEKGYFIPPEIRNSINMVNNEPEDLSYLAPRAGDACIPLSFPPFEQVGMASREDERTLSSPPALLVVGGLKKEPGMLPAVCRTRDMASLSVPSPASNNSTASSSRMSSPRDYVHETTPELMMTMDKFFQAMDTKADTSKDEMEAIDFDSRAPYIPMNGDEDLCLLGPTRDSMMTLQNEVDPGLYGKTEHVFKPKTEDLFEEPAQPPKPSIRDMIGGSTAVASIERPPDTMFQQIKRPLDMNSLEKGPPAHKIQRVRHRQLHTVPTLMESKESVLRNLLLKGEDPNGYRVMSPMAPDMAFNKRISNNNFRTPLQLLTQRDCEVNAPTTHDGEGLLQGQDLLKALELDILRTPR